MTRTLTYGPQCDQKNWAEVSGYHTAGNVDSIGICIPQYPTRPMRSCVPGVLVAVLISAACLGVGSNIEIRPINKPLDLDVSGKIIHAINFGNNGRPNVGGLAFESHQASQEVTCISTAEGVITTWVDVYPDTGYAELDTLLGGIARSTVGGRITIYVYGITPGQAYRLQLVFYTDHTRPMRIYVDDMGVLQYEYDPYPVQTSVTPQGGSIVQYDLVATHETLPIVVAAGPSLAAAISAFVLSEMPSSDVNRDWVVDFVDYCILAGRWMQIDPAVNLSAGPLIDGMDLSVLAENWLRDSSLTAHWALDEAAGGTVADQASQLDGQLFGVADWRPDSGKCGGALQFDGLHNYVTTPFVLNPNYGPFTILAWIQTETADTAIVSQPLSTTSGQAWLAIDGQGRLISELGISRWTPPLSSDVVITDGCWHEVALVWDGSHRALYVDTVKRVSDVKLITLVDAYGGLLLGAAGETSPQSLFAGMMDDIRVYRRALFP